MQYDMVNIFRARTKQRL